jgi:hypothetical protein
MKNIVELAVSKTETAGESAVTVRQNGKVRGTYFVAPGLSLVENALLLLGYASVMVEGEGIARAYYRLDVPNGVLRAEALPQPSLGSISLTRRWSEPLEGYRLDIDVNGVKHESVDARMDLGTLRRILVTLGFTVGHIDNLALAA